MFTADRIEEMVFFVFLYVEVLHGEVGSLHGQTLLILKKGLLVRKGEMPPPPPLPKKKKGKNSQPYALIEIGTARLPEPGRI